ncbi:MAG: hypothetical protein A2158_01395 [Chloroflexi bacterium RBG_13_46_14]|nr:MAG: hypothetical protein A2158_01395 [Chloroflexi bacterium RBG_13_46_14]
MVEKTVTVLSPLGTLPPLQLQPMSPRLDTLDGKTIYIVDAKFPASEQFGEELVNLLKENYPKTNFVYRQKAGSYFADDPQLWAEIKEKGDGMIQYVGH